MTIPTAITGSVMVCNKGTLMVPLIASGSASVSICNTFAAMVTDTLPGANISPFGICLVTKATCSPSPVGNWLNPFANSCIIGNVQSLLEGATLPCAIGGTISVMSAAHASVLIGQNMMEAASEISPHGIHLLTQWEGYELKVYNDSEGNPTIGVGHLLKPGELASGKIIINGVPVKYAGGLTPQQVEDLLRQDLGPTVSAINNHVKVKLNQNQFDALTSFTYNNGTGAFKKSTLLKVLNQGKYDDVPSQIMEWTYARGRVVPGLVNRRMNEVKLWKGQL